MKKEYALIIRTDSYAGNFEREMCAYVTGNIGEFEVSKKYIDSAITDKWKELIVEKLDDRGYWGPVSLGGCESTPGYSGQDVVIWLADEPLDWLLREAKERAEEFNEFDKKVNGYHKDIKVLGVDFIEIERTVKITHRYTII